MDWTDIPDDDKDIDYWKILDDSDKSFIIGTLNKIVNKEINTITKWTTKHQKGLMKSYIKGLQELRKEAFFISMQEFGMFSYVAININEDSPEVQNAVEPKPQSTQLQKELDDIYTNENINTAIEDLGIFTIDEDINDDN